MFKGVKHRTMINTFCKRYYHSDYNLWVEVMSQPERTQSNKPIKPVKPDPDYDLWVEIMSQPERR